MAIIVDKVQKKKDIALSCKELFIQKGIQNITITELAKTAGIGKGTIYEYFSNKEEIVFEIINILMQEHNVLKRQQIDEARSAKDKIKIFYYFFYSKEDAQLRKLYKEFISISLVSPDPQMIAFQTQCVSTYFAWFEEIIQDGIDKEEFHPSSINLARGLFVIGEGLFINSEVTHTIDDIQKEIDKFFDTLFELIKVKK